MESGFHRICQACQHAETRESREDFDAECPQCGVRVGVPRRAYLEPVGFLTSYSARQGKDPGVTRLRMRPVDEARLLTRARPEDYQPSDLAQVAHFFAPAIAREGEQPGRMLVLNRGPNGAGYLWCPRCEYAQPATIDALGGDGISAPHEDPRTGDRCPVEEIRLPLDLAHIFKTDLRGIRIDRPAPDFADHPNDKERREAKDGFLKTLAEAIRLAAADILGTDPRDLRSTFQLLGGSPVIILSDSVSGGAGYCRRLIDDARFSARALFGRALTVLDCPRGDACETSCSRCLNDYSNQLYWDQFVRRPALDWLRGVLDQATPRPKHAPKEAIPVAQASAATLRARMEGANLVAVTAPKLWGAEDRAEALTSALTLRNWLDETRNMHNEKRNRYAIVILPDGSSDPGTPTGLDREIARMLVDYERSEHLRFAAIDADSLESAPRLSILKGSGSEARFDAYFAAPESSSALSGPLAGVSHLVTGKASDSWLSSVQESLRALPGPLTGLGERLKAFRFRPGMPRNLSPLIEGFAGRGLALEIEDPWCGVRPKNRRHLARFVSSLVEAGADIKRLAIVWNPYHGEPDKPKAQADALRSELRSAGIGVAPDITFRDGRKRHFHDRVVTVRSLDEGEKINLRWDVTAGIDNLMSRSKECSVFVEER